MSACVVVFPGQGAQRPGMGRDFEREYPVARAVFDEASDAVALDLRRLCFGTDPRVQLTEYLQPALLTAELAMLRALESNHGLRPTHFAGHSLGEYTALVAAGAVPLDVAVALVRERGRLIQTAVAPGHGAMVAVQSKALDVGALERCLEGLVVDVASVNAVEQVVISGLSDDVVTACERLRARSSVRLKPLAVSAPFHCRLLKPIEAEFHAMLEDVAGGWCYARAGVVASNYTGALHEGRAEPLLAALSRQLAGRVRWLDNARALIAVAPAAVVEVGPVGAVRQPFVAARVPVRTVTCVGDARALERSAA
jgi:malonyl CoA-acyl carrier protein transacylase